MPRYLRDFFIVMCVVFLACMAGIMTRPMGMLASFWPANAILIGMLVRFPHLVSPWSFVGAFIGYVLADMLTGNGWLITLWLTVANLVCVSVAIALFQRLSARDLKLQRPQAVVLVFGICLFASTISALIGAAAPIGNKPYLASVLGWLIGDLVNVFVLLPVLLTLPMPRQILQAARMPFRRKGDWGQLLPLLTLVASIAITPLVGGPGAMAIPLPALLWCAINYSIPGTAVLTLLLCVWWISAFSSNALIMPVTNAFVDNSLSIRLGISLTAISPLMVASLNFANQRLIRELNHAASHDDLTQVLSRRGFLQRVNEVFGATPDAGRKWFSIMMLDLDHFKEINNQHGHFAGDRTLAVMGELLRKQLRPQDVAGRLGGEEFAVAFCTRSRENAQDVALRILRQVEQTKVALDDGQTLRFTTSIGLSQPIQLPTQIALGDLLIEADKALYHAKANGRKQLAFMHEGNYRLVGTDLNIAQS